MVNDQIGKIAILWRGTREARDRGAAQRTRLSSLFEALEACGIAAEPAVYSEEFADEVRDQLLRVNAVLVWVDPIMDGKDRSQLDTLLREVASQGVWVSAHPDVILKIGTKEVLFRTRDMEWGSDIHLYKSMPEMRQQLPGRLTHGSSRVLKQNRGNGGIGVWRVELASGNGGQVTDPLVRVLHALRNSKEEEIPLSEFMNRCEPYFSGSGQIIDQSFQPRLSDGMIRCYMTYNRIVGFGHQFVTALVLSPSGSEPLQPPPRLYYPESMPDFQSLKIKMESEWIPQLQNLLDIETQSLPVIWDADFLLGPQNKAGEDTYVLCEINVSAVFPFPDSAIKPIAQAVKQRISDQR